MKQGSAVFNTVQWIVLDCPASEIWTNSELNLELFRQITQKTWNSVFAIFMFLYQAYCCCGKAEVLWSSKKPASTYPSVLNYEMTKWVYTHIADRVREKCFLSCDCSIFYLVLATWEMNWLHHSTAIWISQALPTRCLWGRYRLWLCELCVDQMGASCNLAIVQILLACCWLWALRSC